jgi:transposase
MENKNCFVGIDWGDSNHVAAIFEPPTGTCRVVKAPHTAEGLTRLLAELPAADAVQGVALEGQPELLVCLLAQAGFTVYAINPKLSKCWRDAHSVAGAKDDVRDAMQLARQVAAQHTTELRPLHVPSEAVRTLTVLCEQEEALIHQRTALVQQLQAVLKQYYPAALDFFDDWTAPAAWQFLLAYSTPEALAKASKTKLCRFLAARHIGMSPVWQRRVDHRSHAVDWPRTGAESAFAVMAQCLARQLQTMEANLKTFRKQIESQFETHPDAKLFQSLPGAGPKLAPRLFTILGEERGQYDSAAALQKLGGVAPVTEQSGNKSHKRMRRACKKFWRNTLRHFAHTSQYTCAWARAFYRQRRANGDTDSTALRKLAFKWLKIIYRMWQDKKPYDEARYLKALTKQHSPLLAYMDTQNTVENPVDNCA